MPPKGRNKPTPMVVFMNKMRESMEIIHKRKFKTPFDEDLYTLCKPHYDALSEEQKQYIKDQAKAEWSVIRYEKYTKLTSGGIPVAVTRRQEQEQQKKKKVEFIEIDNQLNFDINTILRKEIVVIHVNWFCKCNEDAFVPAEVALVRFSLLEGLIESYHCFPYYDFPLGTKGDSKSHSDRTHQIPILGFSEKRKKWPEIYRDIMKFLAKNSQRSLPEGVCYSVYTMNDDVNDITSRNAVRCFLNDIVLSATHDDTPRHNPHEKYIKLCDLAKLMSELKRKDAHANPILAQFMDEQVMEHMLRKDTYLQSRNIACTWHDERDLIPKCSLSRCISWVYIVCDQMQFMNYQMIPGKHMPHNGPLALDDNLASQNGYSTHHSDAYYERSERQCANSEYYVASIYSDRNLPLQMNNLRLGRRHC